MSECRFPDGMIIKPDGENELSACLFQVVEKYRNVTIEVLRCKHCGHVEISWFRQDDTEEVTEET